MTWGIARKEKIFIIMTMITLLTILASIIYCYEAEAFQKSVKLISEVPRYRRLCCYLLVMAGGIAVLFWYIPLPLCFVVLYLILCIGGLSRQDGKKSFYIVNMQFVYFASINLFILGTMALANRADINIVLMRPGLQGVSLILTMLANALGIHLMRSIIDRQENLFFVYERPEFLLLGYSMWFWLIVVFVDSIPSMFRLPADLVSLFLIGSNVLVLFLLAFFHIHVYHITENAYLEEEKIRLKTEEREQRLRTAMMEKDAYIDYLTGAFTRTYAQKQMAEMMDNGYSFCMVYIDLDSLKHINDEQGHIQGDLHLKLFVSKLKAQLRSLDTLSRLGGDEFLILMPDCTEEETEGRMKAIRERMEQDKVYKICYSYGVVWVPAHSKSDIAEYLNEADRRMYEDKKGRR